MKKPMHPLEAMQLISNNLARLSGSRNDHQVLQEAENVIGLIVRQHCAPEVAKKSPETKNSVNDTPSENSAENVEGP